jgi:bifunctional non-homologous end joining protein LigD
MMVRFPDGLVGERFYHKNVPEYFPDWIENVRVKKEDGYVNHLVCNNAATLVYIANQACLTPHVWLSRKDKLDYPDQMIFDLDPPDDDFEPAREAAKLLRGLLEDELELPTFVKTTGSRGVHLLVPLDRNSDFDTVREFASDVSKLLAKRYPDELTTELRLDKRAGRLFLDYLRNSYGQTAVAPYSLRARKGAPVATPLNWEEIDDRELHSKRYNIGNIFQRLEETGDPWSGMGRRQHSLHNAREILDEMKKEDGQ